MPSFLSLLKGKTLAGRYRIDDLLGRGGMGAVYAATDIHLGRAVAVKVIALDVPDPDAEELLRARFLREARAAAGLRHPNLVPVHDLAFDDEIQMDLIVMEMLEGDDLQKHLRKESRNDLDFVLDVILQAADALGAAHAKRLIHRDIKPSNLFLEPGRVPRVRVLDFGIARAQRPEGTILTHPTHGQAPMTLAYAAPEQLRGASDLTPACDVFSLAATAYEMLAGAPPFTAAERASMARGRTVRAAALPPAAGVPEPLARVLAEALAQSPDERHADATAFAEALRKARREAAAAREEREARERFAQVQSAEHAAEVDTLRFHLNAVQQVTRTLSVVCDMEETERLVLDSIGEVFFAWWAGLYVEDGNQYTCRAVRSLRGESVAYAIPSKVVRAVASLGQPPMVPPDKAEIRDHVPAEVAVVAPLDLGGGTAGLLILGRRMTDAPYMPEDLALLRALADASATALRNGELLDRLRAQATIDPLTGCFNRRGFDETLAVETERARRYERPLSFVLVSVEDLAKVNEKFGHQVGDHLLQRVGRALRHTFRSTDTACRIEGGEFVLVFPETDIDEARRHAERLRQLFEMLPPNEEVPLVMKVRVRASESAW
jgi:diguanylate cyclase (GGDEF)-like protein